ncbi:MAG: ScyD/ScyE family protein [Actinomycetota bacterium]|nr:ScyD/ScyE family protein [Actinomycetota bacterium]
MNVRRLITPLAVTGSVAALALAGTVPASAHAGGAPSLKAFQGKHAKAQISAKASVKVLTDQVFGPFNLDIRGGKVLVADGFTGLVSRVNPNGNLSTVATSPFDGGDVLGVASGDGALAWTGAAPTDQPFVNGDQVLTVRRPGQPDQRIDITAFEDAKNPDQVNFYGTHSTDPCVTDFLEAATGGPAGYNGVLDSHAFSIAYDGNGGWYVADAAGNDILWVSRTGHVKLVKVLPPQPITLTAEQAAALGAPDCLIGVTYGFEPVPTDVEVSGGKLYVSTLPGGPEDPSLGARGSVYTLNTNGSHLRRLASGFLGATNLAVGGGHVYVSELFAGQVSKVVHGHGVPVAALPGPLGLEYAGGNLYAGVFAQIDDQGNVLAPGEVVKITLH